MRNISRALLLGALTLALAAPSLAAAEEGESEPVVVVDETAEAPESPARVMIDRSSNVRLYLTDLNKYLVAGQMAEYEINDSLRDLRLGSKTATRVSNDLRLRARGVAQAQDRLERFIPPPHLAGVHEYYVTGYAEISQAVQETASVVAAGATSIPRSAQIHFDAGNRLLSAGRAALDTYGV